MRAPLLVLPALLFASVLGACVPEPGSSTEADVAAYDAVRAQLDQARTAFAYTREAPISVAGDRLFWYDAGFDPALSSYQERTGAVVHYQFPVFGTHARAPNFAATSTLVMTMNQDPGGTAYRVDAPDAELGALELPMPLDGEKWWAYSADGGYVYVVLVEDGQHVLKRWTPGQGGLAQIAVLETMLGTQLGEFSGFQVGGTRILIYEGGRLWLGDLMTGHARWMKNTVTLVSAQLVDGGAIYADDDGEFWRYDQAADERESLSTRIRASDFELSPTYAAAHHPRRDPEWTLRGDRLTYLGNQGLFTFDLETDEVTALALDARDNSEVWRYPMVLPSGTVFALVLESDDGAIGADGTLYQLASHPL